MHSCNRRALCASLAMHSTMSPVLKCNNKHYSRLMLIGIALFRLHAHGEENEWRTVGNINSQMWNSFCQEKRPSPWLVWHRAKLEPFGFGLNDRHAATRQCVCILAWLCATEVVACPFLCVCVFTALGGSIALQVYKLSLKLHRLATCPRANSTGHVGSTVWVYHRSPTGFCWEEAKIILQSRVNRSLLQSLSVMCLGGTCQKNRGKQFRVALSRVNSIHT